jgi:hypothetical protein
MGARVGVVGMMRLDGRASGGWEGAERERGDLGGDWSFLGGRGGEVMGDLESIAGMAIARGTR